MCELSPQQVPAFSSALLALLAVTQASPLPHIPGIEPCAVGSDSLEDCIETSINAYIPLLGNGLVDEVPALDPLLLPFIDTSYDDGNVTVTLNMKNVVIVGLAQTKVSGVKAKSLEEGKLELMCKTSKITATGVYQSEGAVITFPLHSSGPFNVTLGDLTSHLIVHMEGVEDHIQVTEIGLNVMPSQIDVQAGRQLDEDNDLGAALNVYLTENSFELYELVRARLMRYFSEMFKELANRMLSKIPASKVFPNLRWRK